ncbi:hypothetical protein [Hymenobacter sp. B81]|uniref:hypothetical protein n=1 Tax=Hymenobacter sp. B81 TaxID=3344878 RepID=UPI0037DC90C0
MLDTLTELIRQELLHPEWEATRQLLAFMEVEWENGLPKIVGVDIDEEEGTAAVYVAVKGVSFCMGFYFSIDEEIELCGPTCAVPSTFIDFSPWSKELSCEELLSLTMLTPQRVERVEQGGEDQGSFINSLYFEAESRPGPIAKRLGEFLAYLEQDIPGVQNLVQRTGDNQVLVGVAYHIANRNFNDLYLPFDLIARLHRLGLELTFDLLAEGKELDGYY